MGNLLAPQQLRSQLERVASVVHIKRGSSLFRRGDPGLGVYIVRKGEVTMRLDTKTPLYPARVLGPGSILGLPATLSEGAYSLTAEILEDAEFDFVSRKDFLHLLAEDTNLCFQAMDLLSNEIAAIRSALAASNGRRATSNSNTSAA